MDQIANLIDRPRLYFNVDGVGELGGGFFCLAVALLLWLQVHSPQDAIWHRMSLFVVYWGAMLLAIHYGTKAIKERITYVRTGFVAYPRRGRWRAAAIAAALSVLLAVGLGVAARSHWDLAALGSLIGLALAASYACGVARAVRWKWAVAGVMTLGSLAIAFLPPDVLAATANDSWATHPLRTRLVGAWLLTLMFYGAILLISGGISFWLYLRHTQPPAQEAQ